MNTIKIDSNKSGLKYALCQINNDGFLVFVSKTNYVQGSNVTKWVCCNLYHQDNTSFQKMRREGLALDAATTLFNKKISGKQK